MHKSLVPNTTNHSICVNCLSLITQELDSMCNNTFWYSGDDEDQCYWESCEQFRYHEPDHSLDGT